MDFLLAFCGLKCDTCPIFLATRETNNKRRFEMRASIAKFCSEHYGMLMQSEEITDCDGCRGGSGKLFSKCRECRIRECAERRNIESCAFCTNYACDYLLDIFVDDPGARSRLEQMRSTARNQGKPFL
jgi:hypothetical protein